MITAKKPHECSDAEIEDFAAFVRAGGEVVSEGFEGRLKLAESLLFLVQDDCLKGIAAVKNPSKSYKERIFTKAKATVQANIFPFELGWVYVLPSSRGSGFSHTLVETALCVANGQAIFATSRTDNIAMQKVLTAHGFSCHGETYNSSRGKHQLNLFVFNCAKQDASGTSKKLHAG